MNTHLAPSSLIPRRMSLWPAPAFATWCACWLLYGALWSLTSDPTLAAVLATLAGGVASLMQALVWRRAMVAVGFPLSVLASSAPLDLQGMSAGWWLIALFALFVLYPARTWSDAPLFPTPRSALHGLAEAIPLAPGARVLDLGSGVGHGLRALKSQWPQARLRGIEWSGWMCAWTRWRHPEAAIVQGDMWRLDWTDADVAYVFQRPETMAKVWRKACQDLRPGSWLVSLAFAIEDAQPVAVLPGDGHKPLWIYRIPEKNGQDLTHGDGARGVLKSQEA